MHTGGVWALAAWFQTTVFAIDLAADYWILHDAVYVIVVDAFKFASLQYVQYCKMTPDFDVNSIHCNSNFSYGVRVSYPDSLCKPNEMFWHIVKAFFDIDEPDWDDYAWDEGLSEESLTWTESLSESSLFLWPWDHCHFAILHQHNKPAPHWNWFQLSFSHSKYSLSY